MKKENFGWIGLFTAFWFTLFITLTINMYSDLENMVIIYTMTASFSLLSGLMTGTMCIIAKHYNFRTLAWVGIGFNIAMLIYIAFSASQTGLTRTYGIIFSASLISTCTSFIVWGIGNRIFKFRPSS